jgi:hypothetical protein
MMNCLSFKRNPSPSSSFQENDIAHIAFYILNISTILLGGNL